MSTLYLARGQDQSLVVLKVVQLGDNNQEWRRHCLKNEHMILSKMNHKNIIKTNGLISEQGSYGLVLEYIDGEDLFSHYENAILTMLEKWEIARALCATLCYMHQSKGPHYVVHTDIKPENILLRKGEGPITADRVLLIDFGTAQLAYHEKNLWRSFTGYFASKPNKVAGSYTYMSPEQTRGLALDPRSDIYSFGCVLYELFAGRPSFLSNVGGAAQDKQMARTEIAIMHQEDPVPSLLEKAPTLLPPIEKLIMHCLEKEPHDRYPDMLALAADLNKVELPRLRID